MKLSKIITDIFLYTLLAVSCVGAMELLFCHYNDPELYNKITAPIDGAFDTLSSTAGSAYQTLSSIMPEPEMPAVPTDPSLVAAGAHSGKGMSQLATDPYIRRQTSLSEPVATLFMTSRNKTTLSGGNIPLVYYNQADEVWASCPFGSDNVGSYGCGPTVMAMIVSSYAGSPVTPEEMASWAAGQGYACAGSGSYHSIINGTCLYFGLKCSSLGKISADQLREKLLGGGVIVALMGKGHFTSSGHFIILHGTTLSGQILVADPNSRDNSLVTWDAQTILDELSDATDNGAPLWYITA